MMFDSEQWRSERDRKLREWCLGDEDAVLFCLTLNSIIETWDDLIDGDVEVTDDQLSTAFCAALLHLPANRFYQRNLGSLLPTLTLAINAWMDSTAMERSDDQAERNWAFHLRNLGMDIFIQVALICGGMSHMRAVSLEIRRFFTHETFDTWEHCHGNR